jgi:hypothetical protein
MHALMGDRFLKRFADYLKNQRGHGTILTEDQNPVADGGEAGESDNAETEDVSGKKKSAGMEEPTKANTSKS